MWFFFENMFAKIEKALISEGNCIVSISRQRNELNQAKWVAKYDEVDGYL